MELLRSLLFVPGNRANMIEKARSLPADVLVLDLEDSVPAAEKRAAALLVRDSIPGLPRRGQKVYVRVNALDSGLVEEELETVLGPGVDGISLPKANSPLDVKEVDHLIARLEPRRGIPKGHIKIIPWIETAKGLLRAYDTATASPRVVAVAYGAEDFTRDMGIPRTLEGRESHYPRATVAVAARAAEVWALDSPYPDFRDPEGLARDAGAARGLGFQGKFVIHPDQIEPVNRAFSPSPEEVAQARAIVVAFEEAEARGSAATSLEGRMIDIPVAQRARKLLDLARAIEGREAARG